MMPVLRAFSFAAVLLLAFPQASMRAQVQAGPPTEVKELLAKVFHELGGLEKIRTMRGFREQSRQRSKYGTGTGDILVAWPDRVHLESRLNEYHYVTIVAPGVGYSSANSAANSATLDLDAQTRQGQLDYYSKRNVFFIAQHADDPRFSFSMGGSEMVGGIETRIIEVNADGLPFRWFVDPQTGRILRSSSFQRENSEVDYSDWRDVGGFTIPFHYTSTFGKVSYSIEVLAIEINPLVDDRLFERNAISLSDIPFHPAPLRPVPEPPRTANLNIRTQPGGAQAYLNDEFRGMSSNEGNLAISNLKPGSYRLRLSLIGYKERTQALNLVAGDSKTVEVKLEPAGPKPLELNEIEEALKNGISAKRVTELVKQYGVDFALTDEVEQHLRTLGADADLLLAISKAKK